MSFTGKVLARCPKGCDPEETEVWTFVRGDIDEDLRAALLAGDLNLLSCSECGGLFYPETTVVYTDSKADLTLFLFPESYRAEEARWRGRMREDFERMRPVTAEIGLLSGPWCFFGLDGVRELLEGIAELEDESRIAELVCKELDLPLLAVERSFARERGLPHLLPCPNGRGGAVYSRDAALLGVRALLKANDRLQAYRRWEDTLKGDGPEPPLSEPKRAAAAKAGAGKQG